MTTTAPAGIMLRRISLTGEAVVVADVRREVREAVVSFAARNGIPASPGQLDDIVQVSSELVANALRHTTSPEALRVAAFGVTIVVEVDDGDTRLPEKVPAERRGAHGGYGLQLVEELTQVWGVVCRPCGKTVHASLPLSDRPAPDAGQEVD
ncbi:ATP-binding protein [Streptomyces sp. enrichment culture]|uniref:ATP-binding protein n=1 Tax=Streptomyces sp. enrichment culture TaxID=1795815 RepID=UPI003F564320